MRITVKFMFQVFAVCAVVACTPHKQMGYAIIPQEFYPDPEVMTGYTEIEIYAHQVDGRQDSRERRTHQRSMYETKHL